MNAIEVGIISGAIIMLIAFFIRHRDRGNKLDPKYSKNIREPDHGVGPVNPNWYTPRHGKV